MSQEDDVEHEVHSEMRLTLRELAEGFRLIERKRRPFAYWATTVLGAVIGSCVLFGVAAAAFHPSRMPAFALVSTVFPCLLLFAVVPWTRSFLAAALTRLSLRDPVTVVRFSRRALVVRGGTADSTHNLDAYPLRFETARLFVFAKDTAAPSILLPKRIFTDPSVLRTLSDTVHTRAPSAAFAEAVRTLGDDASGAAIRYTLDPDEALSGTMLLARSNRVALVIPSLVALLLLYQIASSGFSATAVLPVLIVFPLVFLVVRVRVLAQLRRDLRPMTLELTEAALLITSQNGSFTWPWAAMRGVRENAKLILVRVHARGAVFLPKRVLSHAQLEMIRRRAKNA